MFINYYIVHIGLVPAPHIYNDDFPLRKVNLGGSKVYLVVQQIVQHPTSASPMLLQAMIVCVRMLHVLATISHGLGLFIHLQQFKFNEYV